jgi:hypothetical protein
MARQIHSIRDEQRRAVLRASVELPSADQMQVAQFVGDYMAADRGGEKETDAERQVRQRTQALADIARAAEWLELASGTAPTATAYRQAAKALELTPFSQILSTYVVWDEAKRDFLGQWRHSSPAQRRLRREAQLNRTQVRTVMASLRLWLDEEQPVDDGLTAYSEWATAHNRTATTPADGVRHPKAMLASSGLGWRDLIAVAREELTLDEACELRIERDLEAAGPLWLIASATVALILRIDRKAVYRLAATHAFPAPAATVGDRRLWDADDVLAFRRSDDRPEREPGWRQHELRTVDHVAAHFGVSPITLRDWRKGRIARVPPISGRAGGVIWWTADALPAVPVTTASATSTPAAGGSPQGVEAALRRIRVWLDADPDDLSLPAFRRWSADHPEHDLTGPRGRTGTLWTVRQQPLDWADWLDVAGNERTWTQAWTRRREIAERHAGPLNLAGIELVALVLGCSVKAAQGRARRPDFPGPVARLTGDVPVWDVADVRAFNDEGPVPRRPPLERQEAVVTARELADMLGTREWNVRALRASCGVPAPDGRVAGRWYWTRERAETAAHRRSDGGCLRSTPAGLA